MSEWKKVKIDFDTIKLGDFIEPIKTTVLELGDKNPIVYGVTNKEGIVQTGKPASKDITNYIVLEDDCFAFNPYRVNVGSIGINDKKLKGCVSPAYIVFRTKNGLLPKFLYFYLKSDYGIHLINWYGNRGGVRNALRYSDLCNIDIPNINHLDQQKILEKFLSASAKIDEINKEIESQKNYIKQLRQNILQEAIEGKLTADWRKQNPVQKGNPDYDAEALFEQIQKEKKILLAKKELKKGNLPKAIRSNKDLLKYPDNWKWARIDDLFFVTKLAGFEFTDYFHLTEGGEIPVVRAQNVRNLTLNKSNLLYIDANTSELLERSALTKPSLLVTFIGAGIGDVGIFEEKERWHLAPNVAKLEPLKNCEKLISIKLIALFMLSSFGQKEIFKYMKATAQPSLSMESIRDICFPLPPLEEQKEIIIRVEKYLQSITELEKQIIKRGYLTNEIMQSILKESFNI